MSAVYPKHNHGSFLAVDLAHHVLHLTNRTQDALQIISVLEVLTIQFLLQRSLEYGMDQTEVGNEMKSAMI